MCADAGVSSRPARPSWPVRLVVCDLDGTLVDAAGAAVPGLAAASAALAEAGVPLALCTGRPHAAARRLSAAAGLRPPVIASYHGALVVDERSGRRLRHLAIPWRCARGIADALTSCGLDVTVYSGEDRWPGLAEAGAPDRVTRLLAIGPEEAVDRAMQRAIAAAGRVARVERRAATMLDVRHRLATKDGGLRAVAGHLGVPLSTVAAAGDDPSDAAMLALAGWGIAVSAGGGPLATVADAVVAPGELAAYLRSLPG